MAAANHCRVVTVDGLGLVTVTGDDADIDAVEVLSTSLMVQATSAMLAAGSLPSGYRDARTKSFRRSFLLSYGRRIGERLTEASRSAAKSTSRDLMPVFTAREQAAERLLDDLSPRSG